MILIYLLTFSPVFLLYTALVGEIVINVTPIKHPDISLTVFKDIHKLYRMRLFHMYVIISHIHGAAL